MVKPAYRKIKPKSQEACSKKTRSASKKKHPKQRKKAPKPSSKSNRRNAALTSFINNPKKYVATKPSPQTASPFLHSAQNKGRTEETAPVVKKALQETMLESMVKPENSGNRGPSLGYAVKRGAMIITYDEWIQGINKQGPKKPIRIKAEAITFFDVVIKRVQGPQPNSRLFLAFLAALKAQPIQKSQKLNKKTKGMIGYLLPYVFEEEKRRYVAHSPFFCHLPHSGDGRFPKILVQQYIRKRLVALGYDEYETLPELLENVLTV